MSAIPGSLAVVVIGLVAAASAAGQSAPERAAQVKACRSQRPRWTPSWATT